VGEPAYYGRFGFRPSETQGMEGVPPQYLLTLPFEGPTPGGTVEHHPAFWLTADPKEEK
jgi:putative acetyltransferase